jgi:hypothetical protein
MASTLTGSQSSGFLTVGTPEIPCVCSSCRQRRGTSPSHCGACQTIRIYPGIFERIRRSMMKRVEASIESHGHFERLL